MAVNETIEIGCSITERGFQPLIKNVSPYENAEAWLCCYGDVMNHEGKSLESEEVYDLFQQCGEAICDSLTGAYVFILYLKRTTELYVFSDSLGSPINLFYFFQEGSVFVSSSLMSLLENSGIDRHLNKSVVPSFLLNGYVVGHQTLIECVQKLVSGYHLHYLNGQTTLRPTRYCDKLVPVDEAMQKWDTVLSENVNRFRSSKSHTTIALSSGFDSNYILHALSVGSSKPINGYSIGGNFIGNELPVVEKIASFYPNIILHKANTDSSTFFSYPEIVRRLDGQIYERGIFLQYELAQAMANNGEEDVVCGECANEVMHLLYNDNDKTDLMPVDSLLYGHDPYICASYVILKKSGILMNSFGIRSHYPFVDSTFKSLCSALRYINGYDKCYHILNCQKQLKPAIFQLLVNRGGATKLESMLDESNRAVLRTLMQNNQYYRQYGKWLREKKTPAQNVVMRTANYNLHIRNPFRAVQSEIRTRKVEWEEKLKTELNISDDVMMSCLYLDIFEKMYLENRSLCNVSQMNLNDVYTFF